MVDDQEYVYSWMEERVLQIHSQLRAIQEGQSEVLDGGQFTHRMRKIEDDLHEIGAIGSELMSAKGELSVISSQLQEICAMLGVLKTTQASVLTVDEFRKTAKRESWLDLPWWLLSVGLGVASLAVAMSLSTLTLIAASLIWLASVCFIGVALILGRERLEAQRKAKIARVRNKDGSER